MVMVKLQIPRASRCRLKLSAQASTGPGGNKIALITGGNTGIGFETASSLLQKGYNVILGCRNEEKGIASMRKLEPFAKQGGSSVELAVFDLADLNSVSDYAKRALDTGRPIDVLLNNAGVMACPLMRTKQGFEQQIGVNHLGHFLLTNSLLPLLEQSAAMRQDARIINVASSAHYPGTIDFNDFLWEKKDYSKWGAYCQSKLANVMYSYELSRRLQNSGITVNALHPGVVATELGRYLFPSLASDQEIPWWSKPILSVATSFLLTPEQGAQTSIYLASSPEVTGVTGKYFDSCKPKNSSRESYDDQKQKKLWDISEELVSI